MLIITLLLGIGTLLLGIGIEKMNLSLPGTYFIYTGSSIILLAFIYEGYRRILKKKRPELPSKFPSVMWLTGEEVMKKYQVSAIELYQHLEKDLPIYDKKFETVLLSNEAQPIPKYDIEFDIEYDISNSEDAYNVLKNYYFKTSDIENYLKSKKT